MKTNQKTLANEGIMASSTSRRSHSLRLISLSSPFFHVIGNSHFLAYYASFVSVQMRIKDERRILLFLPLLDPALTSKSTFSTLGAKIQIQNTTQTQHTTQHTTHNTRYAETHGALTHTHKNRYIIDKVGSVRVIWAAADRDQPCHAKTPRSVPLAPPRIPTRKKTLNSRSSSSRPDASACTCGCT
jgi:hypothetical protein